MMEKWTHITIFDRPYPVEKQAEGIAVHQAVVEGHCTKCGWLGQCSVNEDFRPPAFAWCMRRKDEILDDRKKGCAE